MRCNKLLAKIAAASLAWQVLLIAALIISVTPGRAQPLQDEQLEQRVLQLRELVDQRSGHPELVQLLVDLAVTLQHLNHLKPDGGKRIGEAEAAYRRALELLGGAAHEPAVRVRGNLGALLLEAGRIEDALTVLDVALEQAGRLGLPSASTSGLQFNRAKALSVAGKLAEADAAYQDTALAAHGHDLSSYAKSVAAAGALPPVLLDQAQQVLAAARAALAAAPAAASGGASGSTGSTTVGGGGKRRRKRRKAAAEGSGSSSSEGGGEVPGWLAGATATDVSWLGFGVYKALDKAGQYDAAWEALATANALMRASVDYSVDQDQRTAATIQSAFSAPMPGFGSPDPTPIFVVGLPRSGSTLVEQMLAAHSGAWAAGEDTSLAPLTTEVNRVVGMGGGWQLQEALRVLGDRYVTEMRARAPSGLEAQTTGASPWPARIVDKMLRNLWLVGYIQLLLPRSCIIHVARHPMDAGLSCYAQPFGYSGVPWSWDLGEIAAQVNMTWQLADHWDRVFPGRIHTVHYEELVARPRTVARRLLAACGLSWEPGVMRFHEVDRAVATASLAQVRQPLYRHSVDKWRRYERQLQPLADALGGTIRQYEARLARAMTAAGDDDEEGNELDGLHNHAAGRGGQQQRQHDHQEL